MKLLSVLVAGAAAAFYSATTWTAAAASSRCFPEGFLFGTATSAYQVEGGWDEAGRTPSIWDDFCRAVPSVQCANVADDFFHRYRDDIQLMVGMGYNSFRFSISWSRVMNWNTTTQRMARNQPGIDFYHDLIDELLANNIAPILTLYHWDLPSELQNELTPTSWLNAGIVDHFMDFAELMFEEFGAKVKFWSTFNEPLSFVPLSFEYGYLPPNLSGNDTYSYIATHNVLLSHGKAVQRFRELQTSGVVSSDARISIVVNHDFGYPLNASDPVDVAAAERRAQFELGWFITPLVTGDYPAVMRERAGDRLPKFTEEEIVIVKGSYDLLMLNHYSTKIVTDCNSSSSTVNCSSLFAGWQRDLGVDTSYMPENVRTDSCGKYLLPEGYMDAIKWIHAQDPSADILLTENGFCGNETIDNTDQLWYFQQFTEQVYRAITEENIPIIGYTAWSFMDNYEWSSFESRYGLFHVDYPSNIGQKEGFVPNVTDLARTPRTAAKWFGQLATSTCLDDADGGSKSDNGSHGSDGGNTTTPICPDVSA